MDELIDSICEYVKRPYTDYAVMINGEWGSGKTYFWNNKLRKRLESIKVNGKNYKTIYMSLYGINSLDEISKKIFIEATSINKTLKKFSNMRDGNSVPEYVKTALDMANFFGDFNFNPEKIDFSKNFSIDDKILCFDDLERANVDVIDILGYINNFVEHDGIKTIVICNEKELAIKYKNKNIELKTLIATYVLDKKNMLLKENDTIPFSNVIENEISDIFEKSNDYERIKEKLIGETFEYVPEYPYILSGMILKYSYNDKLSSFLKKNTSVIISAFKKSNTRNLRILKVALNDFEKIFDNTILNYSDVKSEILKTMLTFTLAVSFEIKTGNISKEKLKAISSNDEYMSGVYTSTLLKDTDNFYLREFDNKYFENNFSNYKFFKFIEVYVRTRYFDEKLFNENMRSAISSLNEEKEENSKKYLSILNGEYLKLSDDDFDIVISKVLDEVKEGKVLFYDYITLFSVFQYFVDNKLVIFDLDSLSKIFEEGMEKSSKENIISLDDIREEKENKEIKENGKNKEKNNKEEEDYNYNYVNNLKKKQKTILKNSYNEILSKEAEKLFSYIPNDVSLFYNDMMNKYSNIPILLGIEAEDIYTKLRELSNYDLSNVVNLFNLRYKDNEDLFKKEKKNLLKLKEIITKKIDKNKRSIKDVLLLNYVCVKGDGSK